MIRRWVMVGIAILSLGAGLWLLLGQAGGSAGLAGWLPGGAVMAVESPDFGRLVRDWEGSGERKVWLESGNYGELVRSRLGLKLQEWSEAYREAGVEPELGWLRAAAGSETVLGVYGLGGMEFVYVTKLGAAAGAQLGWVKAKAGFVERRANGQAYYVRAGTNGKGTAAFALVGDYLVAGTRTDLVEGVLARREGRGEGVSGEGWFVRARGIWGDAELRARMNLGALASDPRFRAYWILRNGKELREYQAAVVEARRRDGVIEERREMWRASGGQSSGGQSSGGQSSGGQAAGGPGGLIALAGDDSGLVKVWSKPGADRVASWIAAMLDPRQAPVEAVDREAGDSVQELEFLVDARPAQLDSVRVQMPALKAAVGEPEAAMLVMSTRSGDWVGMRRAVVFRRAGVTQESLTKAVQESAAEVFGAPAGALTWERKGPVSVWKAWKGVAVAALGDVAIVGNDEGLVAAIAGRRTGVAEAGVVYEARVAVGRERGAFARLMRAVDHPVVGDVPVSERSPMLFSENLAGLLEAFGSLEEVRVKAREGASRVEEVEYRLGR
jgi:hypothetical protein